MKRVSISLALIFSLAPGASAGALDRESAELDLKGRGAISISYRKDVLGCFAVKNAEFAFKDKITMSFDFAPSGAAEGAPACTCPVGEGSARSIVFVVFPYPTGASEKQSITSFGSPSVGRLGNLSAANPFLPPDVTPAAHTELAPKRESFSFPLSTIDGKLARRYRVDWQCSLPSYKKKG